MGKGQEFKCIVAWVIAIYVTEIEGPIPIVNNLQPRHLLIAALSRALFPAKPTIIGIERHRGLAFSQFRQLKRLEP